MENNDSQLIYEQYRTITEQARQNPVIDEEGTKRWYNDRNEFHREDGPAIERADGTKVWYINGKLHREDGPAYEGADGYKVWYINNKLHREDGPAYEGADGTKEWWINDKRYRTIPEWASALFKYKGSTRKALKNKGHDYNALLNAVIKIMQSKYGK